MEDEKFEAVPKNTTYDVTIPFEKMSLQGIFIPWLPNL
jgi:hypothetical protein